MVVEQQNSASSLSLAAAASELGVSRRTLARMIDAGDGPKALVLTKGRQRKLVRIRRSDLDRFKLRHTVG